MQSKNTAGHGLPDGLLYQGASLNIIEKGPMVSYGVPRHDP